MYTSRYRSSSPLEVRYRSPSATRSFRDSYTSSYDSYNSTSTAGSLNPSIRRVQDLDLGTGTLSSETRFGRSLSPRSSKPASAVDCSSNSTRSKRDGSLDFSFRLGRPYTSTPLSFSSFRSASRRVDYSDFIKPVLKPILRERPVLKKNYVPRSREEREKETAPITRDRKLIKFREVSDGVARNFRRKLSWAIPDDLESLAVNELSIDSIGIKNEEHVRSRESSLSRIRSRESSLTRLHSPRASLTGGSSRESSLSRLRSPRTSVASCRSREHSLTNASKPPVVSSEKFPANRRPSTELSSESSIPKSKRKGHSDSNKLTSQEIQNSYDRTPAVAPSLDRLHSEINTTLKTDSYDTQSLRRRRRRDSPAELEIEKNEAEIHSLRRRRRRSRLLETTDENKISPDINEEHRSKDKISDSIDQVSKAKYSKFGFNEKNSFEKSFSRDSAQSKEKSCVQDKKSPQKQEISVSYVIPVPKQKSQTDANSNLTSVGDKSSRGTVKKDASARRTKNDSPAVSNEKEAGQENIASPRLRSDKPRFSVVEIEIETKLVNDVLKFKNDKVMPPTGKLTETVSKKVNEENVAFVVNRNAGKSIASLRTEVPEQKPSLSTPLSELSTNIRGNKKLNIKADSYDNFSSKSASPDFNKTSKGDPVGRLGAQKDRMNLDELETISKKGIENRIDKKSNSDIKTVSVQYIQTDGTKIPEYKQKTVCQEVRGQKTVDGSELKLFNAAQKVPEKVLLTPGKINSTSKTEAVSSKLATVERVESNNTNVSEHRKNIPRFGKVTVQEKAEVATDSISKQRQVTYDRGVSMDSKFKPSSRDTEAAAPEVSEKKISEKAPKVEAKGLKSDEIGKDVVQRVQTANVTKDASRLPEMPVLKDTSVSVDAVQKQKHCAEINDFRNENKTTALRQDVGVKPDTTLKKDLGKKLSPTFEKDHVDNTSAGDVKNLKLGKMTIKNADIHSDIPLLKDSDKKISSVLDKSVNSSTENENKSLKPDKAAALSAENERKTQIPRFDAKTPQKGAVVSSRQKDIEETKSKAENITPLSKDADVKIGSALEKYEEKNALGVVKRTFDSASKFETKVSKLYDVKQNEVQSVNTENESKIQIPRLAKMSLSVEKDIEPTVDTISKITETVKVENKAISAAKGTNEKISVTSEKEFEKMLSPCEKQSIGNAVASEPKNYKLTDKSAVQKDGVDLILKQKRDIDDKDSKIKSTTISSTRDADVKTDVTVEKSSEKKFDKSIDSDTKAEVKISSLEDAEKRVKAEHLASRLPEKPPQKDTNFVPLLSSEKSDLRTESQIPSLMKNERVRKVSGKTVLDLEKSSVDVTSKTEGQNSKMERVSKAIQHEKVENESKKYVPPLAKSPPHEDSKTPADISCKSKQSTDVSTLKLERPSTPVPKDSEVRIDTTIHKDLDKKVTVGLAKSPDRVSKAEAKISEFHSVSKEAINVDIKDDYKKQVPRLAEKSGREVTEENGNVFSGKKQSSENTDFRLGKEISSATENKVAKIDTTVNKCVEKEPKCNKYVSSETKMESTVGESKGLSTVNEKVFDYLKSETAHQKCTSKDNEENREQKQSQLPSVPLKIDDHDNKNFKLYEKDTHVAESNTSEKILSASRIPASFQKLTGERISKQNDKTGGVISGKTESPFAEDTHKDNTDKKGLEPKEPPVDKNLEVSRKEENSSSGATNVEIDIRLKIKKGRRVSKDGIPKDALTSIQTDETPVNLANKRDSNDRKINDKPEKFAFKMGKCKTASAVAWTEDCHAKTLDDQEAYGANEFETVDFSLNLKEIVRIPREENIISECLQPVKPIFTDIPVTRGKADISNTEEDKESTCLSPSKDKLNSLDKANSVLPKPVFETESKIGYADSKKTASLCGGNASRTEKITVHHENILNENRVSPTLPQPEETTEDIEIFTKPTTCIKQYDSDVTHDLSKSKESASIYPLGRTALEKELIISQDSTEVVPEGPKAEIHTPEMSRVLDTRSNTRSPVEKFTKHLVQETVETDLSQVSKEKKTSSSFLAGELPPPRNKTPEQNETSGVNFKTKIDQLAKEVSLSERTTEEIKTSDSETREEQEDLQVIQSKAESVAADFASCSTNVSNKNIANILQVSEKESENLNVSNVSNKMLSQLNDISGNTELTSSGALSHIPTVLGKSSGVEEKTSECKSPDGLKIDKSSLTIESTEKPYVPMKTGKISPDANEIIGLSSGKLLIERVETPPPHSQKAETKTTSSEAKQAKQSSENEIVEGVLSESLEPNSTECTKITVCVRETKTTRTENLDSVSSSNVNKASAIHTTIPKVDSSSEDESSEETSEEEASSSEGEESTSDDDNRLPGNWGARNANIAPVKKKRFIGLMTKAALNENVSSLNAAQPNDEQKFQSDGDRRGQNAGAKCSPQRYKKGDWNHTLCNVNCHVKCEKHMPNLCGVNQKLLAEVLESVKKGRLSESDERARNRSQLSSQGSVGSEDTYISFSSPFSSPTEVSQRPEDSPRRTSSASQQDKYQKLRFRKYSVDDFQFLKMLGKGSFGKVLLAELKGHDMYFAIKCLKKDVVLEDDDVEGTMIERRILALGTQHPYMCKLYCTFQSDSHLFFVMEYLNGGDLMFHIQESGRFDQDRARFYAAEITSALKFLHRKGIVYRDIKVDNILLDSEGHIHLVDYGMCKLGVMGNVRTSTYCGTPDYMAPEIVMGQTYNQSVDWWSFGVLLYEMLTGRSPFNGTDEDELFWSICNEEPHYPRFLTKEARQLIEMLLIKSPSQRLGMPACSAGDVTAQPFFSSINWTLLEAKQIQPPFKPSIRSASDTNNFDSSFTMDSATLSPMEADILQSMDQTQFRGFSYTNPHITG